MFTVSSEELFGGSCGYAQVCALLLPLCVYFFSCLRLAPHELAQLLVIYVRETHRQTVDGKLAKKFRPFNHQLSCYMEKMLAPLTGALQTWLTSTLGEAVSETIPHEDSGIIFQIVQRFEMQDTLLPICFYYSLHLPFEHRVSRGLFQCLLPHLEVTRHYYDEAVLHLHKMISEEKRKILISLPQPMSLKCARTRTRANRPARSTRNLIQIMSENGLPPVNANHDGWTGEFSPNDKIICVTSSGHGILREIEISQQQIKHARHIFSNLCQGDFDVYVLQEAFKNVLDLLYTLKWFRCKGMDDEFAFKRLDIFFKKIVQLPRYEESLLFKCKVRRTNAILYWIREYKFCLKLFTERSEDPFSKQLKSYESMITPMRYLPQRCKVEAQGGLVSSAQEGIANAGVDAISQPGVLWGLFKQWMSDAFSDIPNLIASAATSLFEGISTAVASFYTAVKDKVLLFIKMCKETIDSMFEFDIDFSFYKDLACTMFLSFCSVLSQVYESISTIIQSMCLLVCKYFGYAIDAGSSHFKNLFGAEVVVTEVTAADVATASSMETITLTSSSSSSEESEVFKVVAEEDKLCPRCLYSICGCRYVACVKCSRAPCECDFASSSSTESDSVEEDETVSIAETTRQTIKIVKQFALQTHLEAKKEWRKSNLRGWEREMELACSRALTHEDLPYTAKNEINHYCEQRKMATDDLLAQGFSDTFQSSFILLMSGVSLATLNQAVNVISRSPAIIEDGVGMVKKVIDYFYYRAYQEHLFSPLQDIDDLEKWLEEIKKEFEDPNIDDVVIFDLARAANMTRLAHEVPRFRSLVQSFPHTMPRKTYILQLIDWLSKKASIVRSESVLYTSRIETIMLYLHGEPGVGKTTATYHLIAGVYNLLHESMPHLYSEEFSPAQIYSKPKNQDYWDGYKGQFVCYDPEILEQSSSLERAKKISEIMSMCDTGVMNLNYAHVDQKGSRAFTSPLYCCSTNIRDESFAECGMTDPNAFFRRRTFKLEVLKRKNLKKDLSNVDKAWTFRMHIPTGSFGKSKAYKSFLLAIPGRLRELIEEQNPGRTGYLDMTFGEVITLMATEIFDRHIKQQKTASALRSLDYVSMAKKSKMSSALLQRVLDPVAQGIESLISNYDPEDPNIVRRMELLEYWKQHSDIFRVDDPDRTAFARFRSFCWRFTSPTDSAVNKDVMWCARNTRGSQYTDTLPFVRDYCNFALHRLRVNPVAVRLIRDLLDRNESAKEFLCAYSYCRRVRREKDDGQWSQLMSYLQTLEWAQDENVFWNLDGHFNFTGTSATGYDFGPEVNTILGEMGLRLGGELEYHDHLSFMINFIRTVEPLNLQQVKEYVPETMARFQPPGAYDVKAFAADFRDFWNEYDVSSMFWSSMGFLFSGLLSYATFKSLQWLVSPSAVESLVKKEEVIPVPVQNFDTVVNELIVENVAQSLPKFAPVMRAKTSVAQVATPEMVSTVLIEDEKTEIVQDAQSLPKFQPSMKPKIAVAQGTFAENLSVLRNSVFQHLRIVSFQYSDGRLVNCRASLFGRRLFLFRHSIEAYGLDYDCMWVKNGEFAQQCFAKKELRVFLDSSRDQAIIDLPQYFQPIAIPKGRLLSREEHIKFCANKTHKYERMTKTICNGVPQMQLVQANYFLKGERPTTSRFGNVFDHYTRFTDYYIAMGGLGEDGDCGTLYIGTTVDGQVFILGFHVARSGYDSYLCPIYLEDMAKEVAYVDAQGSPVYQQGMHTPDCVSDLQFDGKSNCDSRFVQMGVAKKIKIIPRKTCFKPSVFQGSDQYNSIFPITMAPALLTKTEVVLETGSTVVSPLQNGLVKLVSAPVRILPNHYNQLATDEDEFWKLTSGFYPDTVTDFVRLEPEDVVFGCEYYDGLANDTAVGYDMECLGFTSRKQLWNKETRWIHPALLAAIKKIELALKLGFSVRNIVAACLKDELRDLERVMQGKTRVFCVGGLAHLIVTIMHLGHIVSFMKKHRMRTDVAIGTNPHGIDWALIYRKLQSIDGEYGGGDFSNYDTSVRSQVSYALGYTMCLWAGIDPKSFRGWCIIQLAHSATGAFMVIVNTVVLMDYMNSSGNWLTGVLNSFCNVTLFNSFWFECQQVHPEFQGKQLSEYVSKEFYGDDNLFKIHHDIKHFFNMRTLGDYIFKNFGMTLTLPDKGGITNDFITREQFTFLARDFVEDGGVVLAPLEFDSITGMLLWIRDPKEHEGVKLTEGQQLSINTGVAAMELYHYGKPKFELLTKHIKLYCQRFGVTYLGKSYEYYRERHVLGMLSD